MNDGEQWNVIVEEDNALVFMAAGDGTVTMRAVHRTEWDAVLAANEASGQRNVLADVVRRIVNEADAAHATGGDTHAETAAR